MCMTVRFPDGRKIRLGDWVEQGCYDTIEVGRPYCALCGVLHKPATLDGLVLRPRLATRFQSRYPQLTVCPTCVDEREVEAGELVDWICAE